MHEIVIWKLQKDMPAQSVPGRQNYVLIRFEKGRKTMKISKKIQLLVVLLAACSLSFGAAEKPENQKGQLKFTISDEPEGWDVSWEQSMQIAKPTHVAVIQLENRISWGQPPIKLILKVKGESGDYLERVTFQEVGSSTQPYELLVNWSKQKVGAGGKRFRELRVYATSEQEARKMAEVLIDGVKSSAYYKVRRAEVRLEDYRKRIADAENEIPKIEMQKKRVEAELAEFKKTTYYRSGADAEKSILEWNNLLNVVEVDIIGIKAKLDTIDRLEKKKGQSDDALRSLVRMRLAADVDLAGALARQSAAQSHRQKTLRFLDLSQKSDGLSVQLDDKRSQLSQDQDRVADYQKNLPQLRANVRPVVVVGNEVVIHPVQ
jgi:hypothetical protein